jgi:uncharacterized caspase-like protein
MSSASRATAAAFLLVILAGCSLNYPQPRRFAIVYGINTYPNGNNLTYPVADATSIGAMLVANGFASADVKVATEATATKANLVTELAAFASLMGPNDLFVFYYSGHGTTLPYQGADHDWILPTGSINASSQLIVSGAIFDSELGDMLNVLPTKRRVVILDSCNSGGFIGSGIETDTVPPQLFGHTADAGRITPATIAKAIQNYSAFSSSGAAGASGISPYKALVIAAAGADEFSYEAGAPYYHGIATYYLLQAPASGDLNGDGVVTALETFALMKAGIDQTWNSRYANTDSVFAPHVSGGPIDLVLF